MTRGTRPGHGALNGKVDAKFALQDDLLATAIKMRRILRPVKMGGFPTAGWKKAVLRAGGEEEEQTKPPSKSARLKLPPSSLYLIALPSIHILRTHPLCPVLSEVQYSPRSQHTATEFNVLATYIGRFQREATNNRSNGAAPFPP